MGYDCTLHVVDEQLIRLQFLDELLGKGKGRSVFDGRKDASKLWKQVRVALDGEQPHVAANQVCQLAIAYCAAELPYHYERGFCLSLWPDQEEAVADKVPPKLVGKPDALFERLVTKYPCLRGKFPQQIESSFCPGLFIPSKNVPALLEWMRKRMKRYAKPDQRLFRGLMLVLEEAANRGLAYWEGTEIPVEMRTMRSAEASGTANEFRLPEGYADCIATIGSTAIFGTSHDEEQWTAFADLTKWPPAVQTNNECTISAARSAGGRYLVVSSLVEPFQYRARVRKGSWVGASVVPKLKGRANQLHLNNAGFIGNRVVGFLTPDASDKVPPMPLIESDDGDSLLPLKGVPQYHPTSEFGSTAIDICPGTLRLNDGSDIVVWHRNAYELRGDRLMQTFGNLGRTEGSRFEGLAWDADGFFYVGENDQRGRQVYHIRRGGQRVPHVERLENVMHLQPGPNHSLVLKQGENRKGALGAIYFPNEQTYIAIEPELFSDEDPEEIHALLFSEGSGRLIAATSSRLWAVPIDSVLNAPRYSAVTGRRSKS